VIGQRIGNYLIESLIGEGGMGAVYAAEHAVIGRRAAVKVLKAQYAQDEAVVARFFNEARATTAIDHPSIVEVLDVGLMPGGTPYLVMELLGGETLARRLREVRPSLEDSVQLACQVASALGAAHAKGIVHRDLKPDNLFLVDHPDGVRVKILDFGIAKLRGDLPQAMVQTQTGSLIGTPAYMSPEQCRGVSREIDRRTDIYSLGMILYQMICGRRPFEYEGSGDMIVAHLQEAPPAPSTFVPDLPPLIEIALLRALAKRPDDRFSDMFQFAQTLMDGVPPPAPALAGPTGSRAPRPLAPPTVMRTLAPSRTTLSGASGVRELAPRPPTRSRRPWIAVVAVGLAVAAGLFVFKGGLRRPASEGPSSAAVASPEPPAGQPAAVTPPEAIAPPADPVKQGAPDEAQDDPQKGAIQAKDLPDEDVQDGNPREVEASAAADPGGEPVARRGSATRKRAVRAPTTKKAPASKQRPGMQAW
jgi:eukaryotic-like serine/threonine-protein kinase